MRKIKQSSASLCNAARFSDQKQNSTVLLLGGAGYLGSVLAAKLLAAGRRVRVLDSFMFGENSLDQVRAHPNCELVRGDVRDVGIVVKSMDEQNLTRVEFTDLEIR